MNTDQLLRRQDIQQLIALALAEDIGPGDATTEALVSQNAVARAIVQAREDLVVAGLPIAAAVFERVDPRITCRAQVRDGTHVAGGTSVLQLEGPAAGLLTAERTALNFLQRLSGIATLTHRYVEALAGTACRILDTRKTTPGMRYLQKYAVACGRGTNHRMGLYDRIMIKDNHRQFWKADDRRDLSAAVEQAAETFPDLEIEIEVDSVEEYEQVLPSEPDWILLDNMTDEELRTCAAMPHPGVKLEASGGITLERVRAVAETGVDAISVGALTHSAPAVDLALDWE